MAVSAREFINEVNSGHTLSSLAKASGVAYSCLHGHIRGGHEMSVRNAKKLQEWSEKTYPDQPHLQMKAKLILGVG